ncbi:MAG: alpha/beta hydrolase domain-containing protein [Verrucomicrobia bacterium]|nr:alpha/beta hydrolase domain-containing protein [Verrucomicrobiota bacterium]
MKLTFLKNRFIAGALILLLNGATQAEVVRVEIRERGPFADGHEFGRAGAYEKIAGRLHCEVDPEDVSHARIADIKLAVRNARGRVEFWTDFFLLKPVDARRGNGRLLYDVNNRGNKLALWTFNEARSNNPTTLADAGNGFLMRNGWSVLWCGWSGEVPPGESRLVAGLPVATENGKPITGKVHVEICRDDPVECSPLYWTPWTVAIPYPPVSLDTKQARLTMRPKRSEPAVEIAADQWAFVRVEDGQRVADAGHLWVKGKLRPGWLYDLVYTARDPRVSGLGLAAVRDCVSFFRYNADSPLAGVIERAYVFGISQSGRFVNHFIFEDFNTDEQRRAVFDGALSHVSGAGRGLFNCRFGMATLCATQHENILVPSESFPFNIVPQTDPVTRRTGDILAAPRTRGQMPKVFYTQTSTEYWTRGASLLHTDVDGKRDVSLDPHARLYVAAGAQHLGGSSTNRGSYQNPCNPLNDRPHLLRALLVALDEWASRGVPPPESRYPRIKDGTLVSVDEFRTQFPKIPGVQLPAACYTPLRLDFGPRWEKEGIADIVPPKVGRPYRTLVPAVDRNGNELAGVHLPDVAVPLATYTGWNLRAAPHGAEGMLAPYCGSYLPFVLTYEDRLKANDPRPAVLERYPSRMVYLYHVTEAVRRLRSQRLLLEEDAAALLKFASERQLWNQ